MSNLRPLKISHQFRRALTLAFLVLSPLPLAAQTTPDSGMPATAPVPGSAATPGTPPPGPSTTTTTTAPGATVTPGTTTSPGTVTYPPQNDFTIVATFEHDFSSDLKNGASGDMNVNAYELYGNYAIKITSQDQLIIGGDYLFLNNNFRGTPAPFGNVQQIGATGWYTHDFDHQWGMFGYLYGGFAADTQASFGDGGQVALAAGPTININKDLSLAFGPMFYTRVQDSDTATLMADLSWNFLPQWNLRAYTGLSNGATVSYDVFNDQATILDASLEYDTFWFSTQNTPGGAEQGVEKSDVTLEVGVRQALSKNCFVRGFISGIFYRDYQFHVGDNSTNSFKVDPTAGVGVEFGMTF